MQVRSKKKEEIHDCKCLNSPVPQKHKEGVVLSPSLMFLRWLHDQVAAPYVQKAPLECSSNNYAIKMIIKHTWYPLYE